MKLSSLKDLNQDEILKAISSTEIQDALSRTLSHQLQRLIIFGRHQFQNKEIKKIVGQEFQSLRNRYKFLKKIGKREEQAMKLMTIENRYQELAIDVSKKKLIFEGLKDQLKEKY